MPIQKNNNHDKGPTTLYDMHNMSGRMPKLSGQPMNIGWNLQRDRAEEQQQSAGPSKQTASSFLSEVRVSHKQISDHFNELFNLFEDYTKIIRENELANPKLKRSQSEQFTAAHFQPSGGDCHSQMKTSVSLNSMELSDQTLLAVPPKITREMASQTYWPDVTGGYQFQPSAKMRKLPRHHRRLDERQRQLVGSGRAQTLHIEVESISSSTALQRAPLRQRMWQVLYETRQTLVAGLTMLGENITYVMFVLLCIWCLYLIIGHYYTFIGNNVNRNYDLKPHIPHQVRPIAK